MRKFKVIDEGVHCFALGTEVVYIGESGFENCVFAQGIDRDYGGPINQEVMIGTEVVEIFQG